MSVSTNNIHWFPGHMKKAINQIEEKIKNVDVVVELCDARCPLSSLNPLLEEKIKNKPRLLVLSKSDLADEKIFDSYNDYFLSLNYKVIIGSFKDNKFAKRIASLIVELGKEKQQKYIAKGMKPQPIKTMIIGVPNVGKSTLINKLANRSAAGVENRPGFTRAQQWIKVSNEFFLLDTPGILPMNYEDKNSATKLALVGCIREDILPNDVLFEYLLDFLKEYYPDALLDRFKIENLNIEYDEIALQIAQTRGLKKGSDFDLDKARILLLKEFKDGLLGKMSLDRII